jgi:hypothetical protein
MTNSDNGYALAEEVVTTVAREFQWPGYTTAPLKIATLADEETIRFAGRFELQPTPEMKTMLRDLANQRLRALRSR